MVVGRQQRRRVVAEQRRMVANQRRMVADQWRRMTDIRRCRMAQVRGGRVTNVRGGRVADVRRGRMVGRMVGGCVRNDRLMVADRADVVRRRTEQRCVADQRRMVDDGRRMVNDGGRRRNVRVRDKRCRVAVAEAEQAALGFGRFGGGSRSRCWCDGVQRSGLFLSGGNGSGIGERCGDQQSDGDADNLRAH